MHSTITFSLFLASLASAAPVQEGVPSLLIPSARAVIVGTPIAYNGNVTVTVEAAIATEEESSDLDRRAVQVATTYKQAAINRHNLHRANHGAGPVTWAADLTAAAMKSAKRCTFAHFTQENNLFYGQNLALGNAAPDIAGIITDQWYSEVSKYTDYGKAQPDYGTNMAKFEQWGHFSQVVWKGTTEIGCATWHCKSVKSSATDSTPMPAAYGGDVTYCNYRFPGNIQDQYAKNIGRPKTTQHIADGYGVNKVAIAKNYKTGQDWSKLT